jgi:putative membrane protein
MYIIGRPGSQTGNSGFLCRKGETQMGKLKGLAAGALGGLMGAALMGPVHMMAAKVIRQRPSQGEDATEKVANAIATGVTGHELTKLEKKKGGEIVHFAFGASVGALYGLLASIFPAITIGGGTVFGATVYVGAHAITTPALGLAPSPIENGFAQEGVEFASHLVYGLVTDGVRRVLRGREVKTEIPVQTCTNSPRL